MQLTVIIAKTTNEAIAPRINGAVDMICSIPFIQTGFVARKLQLLSFGFVVNDGTELNCS